jgi:hypothetical protein
MQCVAGQSPVQIFCVCFVSSLIFVWKNTIGATDVQARSTYVNVKQRRLRRILFDKNGYMLVHLFSIWLITSTSEKG